MKIAFKRTNYNPSEFGKMIAQLTGGQFSHVELVFDQILAPQTRLPMCYSSRESGISGGDAGTAFAIINVNDVLQWELIPLNVDPATEAKAYWYCKGSAGREYDREGIIGIATGLGIHDTDARFCSEEVLTVLQQVWSILPGLKPWMVAPSGFVNDVHGRTGLYEQLKGSKWQAI